MFGRISRPGLIDSFGLLVLVYFVWCGGSFLGDPGVGWHLRSGEWMLSHRTIVHEDLFLFSTGSAPWIHDQWLSDVLLAILYRAGGFSLLHVFTIIIFESAFLFVPARLIQSRAASAVLAFFILIVNSLEGSFQWFLRPVIMSFLLFAVVYRFAYGYYSDRSKNIPRAAFFALPALFAIWSNLHPAFVLGLFVIAAIIAGMIIEQWRSSLLSHHWGRIRQLFFLFMLCSLATVCNPYGIELHTQVAALVGNPFFMTLNKEWLPPLADAEGFTIFFAASAGFLLLALIGGWRTLGVADVLLAGTLLAASYLHRRYIPFWALVSCVPCTKMLGSKVLSGAARRIKLFGMLGRAERSFAGTHRSYSTCRYSLLLACCIALTAVVYGGIPGRSVSHLDFPPHVPRKAADVLEASVRPNEHVLNHPDLGGYLSWRLFPRRVLFIDDRNQLLGRDIYMDFFKLQNLTAGWEETWKKYNFGWVILFSNSALAASLAKNPDWQIVTEDFLSPDDGGEGQAPASPARVMRLFRRKTS